MTKLHKIDAHVDIYVCPFSIPSTPQHSSKEFFFLKKKKKKKE